MTAAPKTTAVKNEPNLAHLLTAPGAAGIAVVRLVGPGTADFLARRFSRPLRAGRTVHGDVRDANGRVIDDPVVVISDDGRTADVNLHGGAWVIAAFLESAEQSGFTRVEAIDGVLPEMAVDATDAIESLMLRHLPLAKTEQAIAALLDQPACWRAFDAERSSRVALEQIADDDSLWWLLHPPRVAIVGAPNVGKSTLANQLFAQERSITADMPGTTRDWVGEIANLDGLAVMLVDTPGIRVSNDAIEAEAIERSAEVVRGADLVVEVVDASRPNCAEHQPARLGAAPPGLATRGTEAIVVLNKFDIAQDWARSMENAVPTVATSGEGVDALRLAIRERFLCGMFDRTYPRWWTHQQREAILAAIDAKGR